MAEQPRSTSRHRRDDKIFEVSSFRRQRRLRLHTGRSEPRGITSCDSTRRPLPPATDQVDPPSVHWLPRVAAARACARLAQHFSHTPPAPLSSCVLSISKNFVASWPGSRLRHDRPPCQLLTISAGVRRPGQTAMGEQRRLPRKRSEPSVTSLSSGNPVSGRVQRQQIVREHGPYGRGLLGSAGGAGDFSPPRRQIRSPPAWGSTRPPVAPRTRLLDRNGRGPFPPGITPRATVRSRDAPAQFDPRRRALGRQHGDERVPEHVQERILRFLRGRRCRCPSRCAEDPPASSSSSAERPKCGFSGAGPLGVVPGIGEVAGIAAAR